MSGGPRVRLVDRLVRLGLDHDLDRPVVAKDPVQRLDQLLDHRHRRLALHAQRALTSQPQHQVLGAEDLGDVDRTVRTPQRLLPVLRDRSGVRTVLERRVEPQPGRHELSLQAIAVEQRLQLVRFLADLGLRLRGDVGNGVIVMELDRSEAHLGELRDLVLHAQRLTSRRAVDVGAVSHIPGTGSELDLLMRVLLC